MDERPWFLWDVQVTGSELRERLRDPDARIRAQWAGQVLREATYREVWEYLSLEEILRDWPLIAIPIATTSAPTDMANQSAIANLMRLPNMVWNLLCDGS